MKASWSLAAAACLAAVAPASNAQPTPQECAKAKASADPSAPEALAGRVRCLLAGVEPSDNPIQRSRELLRPALQSGSAVAGFLMYAVYSADPAYTYIRNGNVDAAQYDRLAALPVSERGPQIEALDALALGMNKGNVSAAVAVAAYLMESSAPGNAVRLRNLLGRLQHAGVDTPQLQRYGLAAVQATTYGPTHASPKAFTDALNAAGSAVAASTAAAGGKPPCNDVQLSQTAAGDIAGAEYLPLTNQPLVNTYLLRGTWTEQWTFAACGTKVPAEVRFTADGWSGAAFKVTLRPAAAQAASAPASTSSNASR
ncbi:hypothetical protein [Piscinibacter terrae]|uniref:Uncharacterized protein n=1 Tax=Piscinibacter terrae TaxID=2496871 RepID=A0A3N7HXS8_9BURK|nr:hypothetical protein [Albitalea terrae]RQP26266.1 hypothetical protein DZC73_04335 [Albitalea terrae]